MVAAQRAERGEARIACHRPAHDARRIRAAIDQIAEQQDVGAGGGVLLVVGVDQVEQQVEQVEPAVHVPDRVDALARRDSGLGCAGAAERRTHGDLLVPSRVDFKLNAA